MTVITVFKRNGRILGFSAKGHAGFARSGEDIVCAAISALTQTTAMGVIEIVHCPVSFDVNDGELSLMLKDGVSDEKQREVELLVGTMLLGLSSIKKEYNGYLKLIEREV